MINDWGFNRPHNDAIEKFDMVVKMGDWGSSHLCCSSFGNNVNNLLNAIAHTFREEVHSKVMYMPLKIADSPKVRDIIVNLMSCSFNERGGMDDVNEECGGDCISF
jgi:hypothetical protein